MTQYDKVKDQWVHFAVTQLRVAHAYDKLVQKCLDRVDLLAECAELPFDLSARALLYVTGNGIGDC